jgi:hypothetical protein
MSETNSEPKIYAVRRAYGRAAAIAISAALAGSAVGLTVKYLIGPGAISALGTAAVGAAILLWATIALQGWSIQTFGGVTLTERVNRWWFWTLYWMGTALAVGGVFWA